MTSYEKVKQRLAAQIELTEALHHQYEAALLTEQETVEKMRAEVERYKGNADIMRQAFEQKNLEADDWRRVATALAERKP